ncbi:MAG: LptF/LptG family permease [Alphaproteobacteria bacterium]|nr:LptF/LptG family permease [Alphaproteobacteria bacterium]
MKTLSRYSTKQLVAFFVMLLLVLSGLAWMMQILTLLRFLIQYGISIWEFLGLTSMMLPMIISIIMPFSAFISVMFVYNKLIADREITVMASAGMSPMQIARPALWFAGILMALHFVLNIFAVPATQAKFYDTQWEMRYGLAHMKLQEATFTQMARGLVVFVEKVSGHDLSGLMLYDSRSVAGGQIIISAEKGKLVNTDRGLSIVMTTGSVQIRNDGFAIGTFDSFDMDLNVSDREPGSAFKVRRLSTPELIRDAMAPESLNERNQRRIISELSTRFLSPLMNMMLVLIGLTMLLKSSLLRRGGFNMTAPIAVAGMAGAQSLFMVMTDKAATLTGFFMLFSAQAIIIIMLFFVLSDVNKKGRRKGT